MSIHQRQSDIECNAIMYTYPGGQVDIICASDRGFKGSGWEESGPGRAKPERARREAGKKSEGDDLLRSMRRARAKLRRLALANEFAYFVTLTLDKSRVDRYDPAAIMRTMNRWLDNQVRRKGLAYVLVPERHQDGALHFHGFFNGALPVEDSGTIRRPGEKKPRRPGSEAERAAWIQEGGQVVFNLPAWPLGFSTALRLRGEYGAAVGYVCKYVGKQEGQRPMGRWYYSGGALKEPHKEYLDLEYRALMEAFPDSAAELEIPGTKICVVHTAVEKPVEK